MRVSGPGWLMWEAKAVEGRADALLVWALDHAPAAAQIFRSADRVVLITQGSAADIADPPGGLLARPPYVWPFERVR